VVPFTIFFILWIFFFCLLEVILGQQTNLTEADNANPPFFKAGDTLSYFFYNLENAVGQVNSPQFVYWDALLKP
jgi:hypothetical protein